MTDSTKLAEPKPTKKSAPTTSPKLAEGWLKSGDGRYHKVDDVDTVMLAYPGQYVRVEDEEVNQAKIGWPEATAED